MSPTKEKKTATKRKDKTGAVSLVIVESPTKARTLNRYLGDGYTVMASGGHIIDLPPKSFGVDIESGFKPHYELLPGKAGIAKALRSAASEAEAVFLATDPDREGEAIAWHISTHISRGYSGTIRRVQFNEITKRAVLKAIEAPGDIDMRKVDAQQARRIMDRLVGYQVSPVLWKTVAGGLSAGRVQSVALRMICEREVDIDAFVQEEYWTIDGRFRGEKIEPFPARLHKLDGKKAEIPDRESSDKISERLLTASYRILDIKRSRRKRQPYPPYITSTLQQDGGRRLGYSVKKTMSIAQRLYEGLELGDRGRTGLITYMRTDSMRVSSEAVAGLRDWLASEYGTEFLAPKPRSWKRKKGAVQDAHEAVRPTDIKLTPDEVKPYLKPDEFRLYDLIWRRFAATQMRDAEVDVTVVRVGDNQGIEFRATGQVIVIPGFLTVYSDLKINGEAEDNGSRLPVGLKTNMVLELVGLDPKQRFTQPPPRYTEVTLVKELDELGIGRPSTYSAIISTILDRKYVEKEKRSFHPTDLGKTVNHILVSAFPDIFNVKFTARMEEELDKIETGTNWQQVLNEFYQPFSAALKVADDKSQELKKETLQPTGRDCPECGRELIFRWGKRGRFIACTGFPSCRYSENIDQTPPVEVSELCPECGGPMVLREGKFGRFLGCLGYPKCKGIMPLSTGCYCPVKGCTGKLVERRSKKGKLFYACDRYPKCKFISWNAPASESCPNCGAPTLFEKSTRQVSVKYCHRCDWKSET